MFDTAKMASPPAKTLTATGPVIIVIIVIAAALLGYYQIVYYPTVAPTSTTLTIVAATPHNVTVTIPSGALSDSPVKPTSYFYQPDVITVVAGYNSTVIWRNNDSTTHTVTAATNDPDPRFLAFGPTSQPWNNIEAGEEVNFTFTTPGTYNYSCSYHVWMKGEVIVLAGNSSSSTASGSNASSTSSAVASILGDFHFTFNAATVFASSLATRIGSGIAPWRVNLSSNLFETFWLIPALLTKIS